MKANDRKTKGNQNGNSRRSNANGTQIKREFEKCKAMMKNQRKITENKRK